MLASVDSGIGFGFNFDFFVVYNYMFGVHVMRESNDLTTNPILLLCVG